MYSNGVLGEVVAAVKHSITCVALVGEWSMAVDANHALLVPTLIANVVDMVLPAHVCLNSKAIKQHASCCELYRVRAINVDIAIDDGSTAAVTKRCSRQANGRHCLAL